jgi:putative two-component system response regulator
MVNFKKRILIVDDEAAIRRLLHQKLSKLGYICEEADSTEHALSKLAGNQIELAILDIKMPGKSGVDVLRDIEAYYPDTAVIMATAVAETSIAVECMKHGAEDYICKPFNLDEVALSVERTLEKRELQLQIREYQQSLEERVGEQTDEIRKLFLGAIEALVFALEAKDKYTGGHSRRVAEIAVAIGNKLGFAEDEIDDLRWAGLLHDVGKIAVDQMIQNKTSRLTEEEYEHIMIHAHVGAGIVKPVVNNRVVEIIEHHHDHYGGGGLHQVVVKDQIPFGARILAVADAYDAMTSDRPYRPAMSQKEAFDEIERCIGIQFDPVVAGAFLQLNAGDKMLTQMKS